MFTIDQIKSAHSKVKSGADFPKYVQELKNFGVIGYDHFVSDGHSLYAGKDNFTIPTSAVYPPLKIAEIASKENLGYALNIHQQGQTDYLTFCKQAAEAGVQKWSNDFAKMTCTYMDKDGEVLIVEEIPVP